MTNGLLYSDKLIGQFVHIMTKGRIIDMGSGPEMSYAKNVFFRGCDGLCVYYSLDEGKDAELSGFIPILDVLDVVRVDHMENLMNEEG